MQLMLQKVCLVDKKNASNVTIDYHENTLIALREY